MGIPMAFTTGTTYTYTDRMFKRGTIGLNLPSTLAPGYNWFNGVDVTSSQYLIYSDTYTTGLATQANSRPTAWTTPDKTDASLLGLINTLPERIGQTSFTNVTDATTWLQESNRYFLINSGYEDIVTSGLTLSWDAAWYNSFKTGNTLWYDISGSYVNGTFTNGPSFSTSNGGSISFDGTDDYVSASVSSPGPPITVETICRFNESASDSTNYRYVFSLGSESSGGIIGLAKAISQSPASPLLPNQGYCYIGGNNPRPINYIFTGSAYHHVVLQVLPDNKTIKCYIDGVEVSVSNDSTTISLSSTLNVGRYVGANWYLNGNIQTFRIYNRALSQAEILKNYNAQKGRIGYDNIISSGLKLNLNSQTQLSYSGGGNNWYDLSGNNNTGTLTNGPTFDSTTRSIVFDGADDYAIVSNPSSLQNQNLTVSTWIKPSTATNQITGIIDYEHCAGGPWVIQSEDATTNRYYYFGYQTGNGFQPNTGPGIGVQLTNSVWQNLVFTKNGTSVIGYLNGVQKFSANANSANIVYNTGRNLVLGKTSQCASREFNGSMSNTQIYNRALSASEILQNYYQGNVVTSGLVLALDAGNLVSYGGTGTSWKDLTTNGNNGTLVNGPTYSTLNGGSIVFDGLDDTVSFSAITLGSTFTISQTLVASGTYNYGYMPIGGGSIYSGSTYRGYVWFNTNSSFTTTELIFAQDGEVGGFNFTLPTPIPRYTLFQYTLVKNGSTAYFYINGNLITTQSVSAGTNFTVRNLGWSYSSYYMNRNLYNTQIYNRALSDMEVQQNFNANRGRYGL